MAILKGGLWDWCWICFLLAWTFLGWVFVWWAGLVVTLDNWSRVFVSCVCWSTWGLWEFVGCSSGYICIASTYVDCMLIWEGF